MTRTIALLLSVIALGVSAALAQSLPTPGQVIQGGTDLENQIRRSHGLPEVRNPGSVPNQPTMAGRSSLTGSWRGTWTNQRSTYGAMLTLKPWGNDAVEGEIEWTLLKPTHGNQQAMIGKTAIELVRGSFDAGSRLLLLKGYAKRDPNNIIGLDEYRLRVGDGANTVGGETLSPSAGGTWAGRLQLERIKPGK